MKTPTLFKEYIWLVNTIHRARRITLADINRRWVLTDMSGGVELARSTFNRHKDAIEDIFGIYIECDRRSGYQYYIGNDHVLAEDSVQNWILTTLSVSNLVSESRSVQHRILLENIPSNGEYLQSVIEAMQKSLRITITYRRYQSAVVKSYDVDPYCVKLFRQRWYLLARFGNGKFAMFSFDRIEHLCILPQKFRMETDFDAAAFFSECYGVVIGDGSQSERILLRAYGNERSYISDLPLHHSQHQVAEAETYADFEIFMRPTSDFIGHILSRGKWMKVLSPQWLADEVRQRHAEAASQYGE